VRPCKAARLPRPPCYLAYLALACPWLHQNQSPVGSCGIEAQDHLVDLTILGSQWDQEDDDDAVDEPPARD
jgi:hypothetical protein